MPAVEHLFLLPQLLVTLASLATNAGGISLDSVAVSGERLEAQLHAAGAPQPREVQQTFRGLDSG